LKRRKESNSSMIRGMIPTHDEFLREKGGTGNFSLDRRESQSTNVATKKKKELILSPTFLLQLSMKKQREKGRKKKKRSKGKMSKNVGDRRERGSHSIVRRKHAKAVEAGSSGQGGGRRGGGRGATHSEKREKMNRMIKSGGKKKKKG